MKDLIRAATRVLALGTINPIGDDFNKRWHEALSALDEALKKENRWGIYYTGGHAEPNARMWYHYGDLSEPLVLSPAGDGRIETDERTARLIADLICSLDGANVCKAQELP